MIFAEGDDPRTLRAAVMYQRSGFGKSLVVGREADVKEKLEAAGLGDAVCELEVVNAAKTDKLNQYKDFLYDRLNRRGFDQVDIHRLAARDRHVFSALMLAHGDGDGLVTGANANLPMSCILLITCLTQMPNMGRRVSQPYCTTDVLF